MRVLVENGEARAVAPTISIAFADLMDYNPEIDQQAATQAKLCAIRWWKESGHLASSVSGRQEKTFGDFRVIVDPKGTTEL